MLLGEVERLGNLGSWVWDPNTDHVSWSNEMFRIFGHDPTRERATTELFYASVHPDDREFVRAASDRFMARGAPGRVDCRVLQPSGRVRHVSME
ncbi:MAG TPA: PAS domain-containing protein, partial [Polyangiales bacterium]|nr:PAS domain-containing protein [Polyangiales bacterium]